MYRKGIILAGGSGTRLRPLTNIISKQLLPIYNKPMIYYPISTLMLGGVREFLIISDPANMVQYKQLLGNGSQFGLSFKYCIQENPEGISQAYTLAEEFLNGHPSVLILGDNFYYSDNLTSMMTKACSSSKNLVFLYKVANPQDFGIAYFKGDKIDNIVEKPKSSSSNNAVTGIYFLDNNAPEYVKNISASARGELEITDLLNVYIAKNELHYSLLGRGCAWLDTGSASGLLDAGTFVRTIEERQGLLIGSIEEISVNLGYVNKKNMLQLIEAEKSGYYKTLKNLINRFAEIS